MQTYVSKMTDNRSEKEPKLVHMDYQLNINVKYGHWSNLAIAITVSKNFKRKKKYQNLLFWAVSFKFVCCFDRQLGSVNNLFHKEHDLIRKMQKKTRAKFLFSLSGFPDQWRSSENPFAEYKHLGLTSYRWEAGKFAVRKTIIFKIVFNQG